MTQLMFTLGWAAMGACAGMIAHIVVRRREPQLPHRQWRLLTWTTTTAGMFALLAWKIATDPAILAPSWLAAVGVPLTALDFRQRRLPNWLVLPTYPATIGLVAVAAAVNQAPSILVRAIAGMAVFVIFMGSLYWIFGKRQGVGGGDVKLSGVIGVVLGQSGWTALSTGMMVSWVLAAIGLLTLSFLRQANKTPGLPFGPFLLVGGAATLLIL
jgi:leader peptidase (prepilin peptidase)/N-methyltransferase